MSSKLVKISALEDLQKLLRKSVNEEVCVVDCTTSPLLPVGENYGSFMLRVDVLIRRTKNGPIEPLRLVAKTLPSIEYIRSRIKTAVTFEKEMFAFEKLAPAYRKINKDFVSGFENDLFAKFYGGRVAKDESNPDNAGENAVLLLENLKNRGYRNMDRKKGLDLSHAKLAVTELARFHGLGKSLRYHNSAVFEEAKKYLSKFPFYTVESEYHEIINSTIKLICRDPRISEYEDRIRALVLTPKDWTSFQMGEAIEPWVTIIHGDFWVNNIMFRQGQNNTVDVKFVDFQITRICNPLFDLSFFLFASTSPQVLDRHMDTLLRLYLDSFVEVLCKTGISAVKFMTMDVASDLDTNELMSKGLMADGNKLFFERTWAIVSKYVSKGWL